MKLINLSKKQLNDFVLAQDGSFLQSWEWGEFQSKFNLVERVGLEQDGKIIAAINLIKKTLPFGFYYWYAPHGSIQSKVHKVESQKFFSLLKDKARKEKVVFLRFEPNYFTADDFKKITNNFTIKETIALQPKQTIVLDLNLSEEALLNKMHSKTRYNIRLAEKKGVEVFTAKEKDFASWWQLLSATGGRDGFRLHGKKYYEEMLKLPFAKLYLAKQNDKILAGIFVTFFGSTATYVHGASSSEHRELMAPYLLQWRAIGEAKKQGCLKYDFFGIDSQKWPGVTRFKEGFMGDKLLYLGTFDIIFSGLYYNLYSLLRKLRRAINL